MYSSKFTLTSAEFEVMQTISSMLVRLWIRECMPSSWNFFYLVVFNVAWLKKHWAKLKVKDKDLYLGLGAVSSCQGGEGLNGTLKRQYFLLSNLQEGYHEQVLGARLLIQSGGEIENPSDARIHHPKSKKRVSIDDPKIGECHCGTVLSAADLALCVSSLPAFLATHLRLRGHLCPTCRDAATVALCVLHAPQGHCHICDKSSCAHQGSIIGRVAEVHAHEKKVGAENVMASFVAPAQIRLEALAAAHGLEAQLRAECEEQEAADRGVVSAVDVLNNDLGQSASLSPPGPGPSLADRETLGTSYFASLDSDDE